FPAAAPAGRPSGRRPGPGPLRRGRSRRRGGPARRAADIPAGYFLGKKDSPRSAVRFRGKPARDARERSAGPARGRYSPGMGRDEHGVTPQHEDFSAWYNELVLKAQLVDRGPAKGTMV